MGKDLDVSIIIVNYNTSNLVIECVKSIKSHTQEISYEIIIVDNNSSISQKQLLNGLSTYNTTIIELQKNIGFGRANNEGLIISKGRNILFLNPDTILLSNALKSLNQFLNKNIFCGACGGNLYNIDGTPTHSHNINFPGFIDEIDQALKRSLTTILYGRSTLFNFTEKPQKVAYITGADLMVKKSVLNEVGGFNPKFFMYYEDTELQYRIKKRGYEIYNVPDSRIIHLEGKSFSISKDRETRILTSRSIYFSLTHNRFYCWGVDKFYLVLNYIGYGISILFAKKELKYKLRQRITILNNLNKKH